MRRKPDPGTGGTGKSRDNHASADDNKESSKHANDRRWVARFACNAKFGGVGGGGGKPVGSY